VHQVGFIYKNIAEYYTMNTVTFITVPVILNLRVDTPFKISDQANTEQTGSPLTSYNLHCCNTFQHLHYLPE
jgi:hypothetical protein